MSLPSPVSIVSTPPTPSCVVRIVPSVIGEAVVAVDASSCVAATISPLSPMITLLPVPPLMWSP